MIEGQPEGHVLCSCFVEITIAKRLQLWEGHRSARFRIGSWSSAFGRIWVGADFLVRSRP
jgi:hypothetical protein